MLVLLIVEGQKIDHSEVLMELAGLSRLCLPGFLSQAKIVHRRSEVLEYGLEAGRVW